MISVSELCLCLRDTKLELNVPCSLCRWLVEDEDVEDVHGALVRHHQCLIIRLVLRL